MSSTADCSGIEKRCLSTGGAKRSRRANDLSQDDWLEAGQALLKRGGLRALKVRRLADSLRVSTGSFYHHFQDFDGYHAALAKYFAGEQIERLIAEIGAAESTPMARIRHFAETVRRNESAELSLAMRAWAKSDPRAAASIVEHDDKVMSFVAGQLVQHGFEPQEAITRAYALMAVGLGEIHVPASIPRGLLRERLFNLLCGLEAGESV